MSFCEHNRTEVRTRHGGVNSADICQEGCLCEVGSKRGGIMHLLAQTLRDAGRGHESAHVDIPKRRLLVPGLAEKELPIILEYVGKKVVLDVASEERRALGRLERERLAPDVA